MKVDTELLKKYNRPGPRYTSYPTAVQFNGDFGPGDFVDEIKATNQGDAADLSNLSLYFHLPFCKKLCYFCGCNMVVTKSRDRIADYLDALKMEIDAMGTMVHPGRRVTQLHWGGGTPSYLTLDEIRDLMAHIKSRFTFARDAEVSIEIDPRNLTETHLPILKDVGFNRVSFGVQDLNPEVQKAINRVQPEALNRRVVEQSRELGYDSVNIDLIYGLPHQTPASFADTLDRVIDLAPDRFAVFNYAHVPWLKKHQQVIPEDALPSTEDRLRIIKYVIEHLTESGYAYIGMDHFAREADDLTTAMRNGTLHRNFQGYTTHADAEIYAMGVSSISQLHNVYAQNEKDERTYCDRVREGEIPTTLGYRLSQDDQLRRYVIMEIMCNSVVRKDEVKARFGVDFDTYFAESLVRLDEFKGDGLVTAHPDRIEVSEEGRLVIRNIAMAFDAYLDRDMSDSGPKYSRTI